MVRDFRLQRFLRDNNAMNLKNGIPWTRLLREGVLEESLRRLCLVEDEQFEFLVELMIRIGLFSPLKSIKASTDSLFFVPSVLSPGPIPDEYFRPFVMEAIEAHIGSDLIEVKFLFNGFLPAGYYDCLIAILVRSWYTKEIKSLPTVVCSSTTLLFGR